MRPGKRTFSKVIRRYILSVLVLTLVFYTIILNLYLIEGTWAAASFEMEMFGKQYERAKALDPDLPLPTSPNIKTYANWADLPEILRKHYPENTIEKGGLTELDLEELEVSITIDSDGPELYHIIFPYEMQDGSVLFLVQAFRPDDENSAFFDHLESMSQTTLFIAGSILVLFVLIVWLLGRSLSRPSQRLADWAQSLSSDSLSDPIPDFKFVELNAVAKELHQSLCRIDGFVEREHLFLRQASHELRTPVTVIGGTAELLQKQDLGTRQNQGVTRILRASKNMKLLIETLLWLGREIDPVLNREQIDVAALLSDALDELSYLSDTTNVVCEISIDPPAPINAPLTALHIVVSNLLRNAFQHTPQGSITIILNDSGLLIENQIDAVARPTTYPQGQGVGLDLVHRICAKCGWTIDMNRQETGGMRAMLTLQPDKNG